MSLLPALVRHTVQRRRVAILLYHDPSSETLERHLITLQRRYSVIPLRSFAEALQRGSLDGLPPRSLVITFDDGHRRNAKLEPVLRRLGVPVTIFVCSGIVGTRKGYWFLHVDDDESYKKLPDAERIARLRDAGFDEDAERAERDALSAEEVEALKPVVDFQSHTVSHPILTLCPPEKAAYETAESKRELERRFGLDIYAFSYPNGDHSEREVTLAREAGYTCALIVGGGLNDARTDPFRLRRVPVDDDDDGVSVLLLKACGIWSAARRLVTGSAT